MTRAETWAAVFKGHSELNPMEQENVKKQIMLERFQTEHSGFNFADAEFTGQVPDPKTFLVSASFFGFLTVF